MAWDSLIDQGWVSSHPELGFTIPAESCIIGSIPVQITERKQWVSTCMGFSLSRFFFFHNLFTVLILHVFSICYSEFSTHITVFHFLFPRFFYIYLVLLLFIVFLGVLCCALVFGNSKNEHVSKRITLCSAAIRQPQVCVCVHVCVCERGCVCKGEDRCVCVHVRGKVCVCV